MATLNESDNLNVIREIKDDLLKHIQKIFDTISEDDFEPIWSILKEKVHKDTSTDDFKSELRSQLELDFNNMWESTSLENSLIIMEMLKQKFRNDPKPKWRPMNQPVSAQILPLEIQLLNHKKKFLKDSIVREKLEISSLTEKLDAYRKSSKHLNYTRDEVLREVNEQITVYEEHLEKPNTFEAVALDMLLN